MGHIDSWSSMGLSSGGNADRSLSGYLPWAKDRKPKCPSNRR